MSDEELLNKLKAYRARKTAGGSIPAYRVFTNEQLDEIVRVKPKSHEMLLGIKGIGKAKDEKYGDDILKICKTCGTRSTSF